MRRANRRAWVAGLVGGGGALLVFLAVLADGQFSLLQENPLGGFYDLQARSLLRGQWNVPSAPVGVEGIRLHGETFIYFGPFPALLRLPIAAITDQFDGRLTQISMLAAFLIALASTTRLTVKVRGLVCGDDPVSRGEQVAIGGFVFLVGAGSVLLFLASHAYVYHEAALWGAALALSALDGLIGFLDRPSAKRLCVVSALCAAALLTRVPVGLGPLLALALIGIATLWPRASVHLGVAPALARRSWRCGIAIAVIVPMMAAAAVNFAKFGSAFDVPFDHQVFTAINPARRQALAANGGSAFGLQFVPTTALQYTRPDALQLDSLLPWLKFGDQPTVIGGVHFDEAQPSSSLTATAPALVILAAIGAIALLRRGRGRRDSIRMLRPLMAGTLLAGIATLAILQVAQRYLTDFVPVLVLAGAVGAALLGRRLRTLVANPWVKVMGIAGLLTLGVWSVWANLGLAVLAQHELGADVSDEKLADFVELQYRVHEFVPGGSPPDVAYGDIVPATARRGSVFVADRCAAVYWSTGRAWRGLTRTLESGQANLSVRLPAGPSPIWEPLLESGPPGHYQILGVQRLGGGRVRFGLALEGKTYGFTGGKPVRFDAGRPHAVTAVLDARTGEATVRLDGRRVYSLTSSFELAGRPIPRVLAAGGTPAIGVSRHAVSAPRLSGEITVLPATGRSVCAVVAPRR